MRTRKAALNLATSILRNATGLLLGMVATPIILSYLGEERFGIFRVLQDWFGHLALIEFGLYAAILSFMAKVLGENRGQVGQALRVSIVKYRNVLAMQAIAIGLFAVFFKKLVPVSPALQNETWIAFLVMTTSIFFIFSQIFKAQLEASQRGYLVSYVMMFQNVFTIVVSILFLVQGWALPGQAAAFTLGIAVAFVAYVWLCRDQLKFLRAENENFGDEAVFTRQRTSLFVTELCARASLMSDNLMITFVMGVKDVTPFFITQRLIQVLQLQLQNISGAAWPALGELYYQKKLDVFRERILQLTEVVAFLSGVSLCLLVLFNPSFIILWTGKNAFAGVAVSDLAAVNSGFFALQSLWGWCFSATHKTDRITKVFIAQAIVNVSLSFLLTKSLGIVGPVLAAFIGYSLVAIGWMSKEVCRTFEISFWRLSRMWIVPFALPVGLTIAAVTVLGYPQIHSWGPLIATGCISGVVIFAFCYTVLVSAPTKHLLHDRIKNSKVFKR